MNGEAQLFVAMLVILLIFLSIGIITTPMAPPSSSKPAAKPELPREYRALVASIFTHNLMILLVTLLPVVGWAYAVYQAYVAGQVIALALPDVPRLQIVLALLTYPHVYLELGAYAMGITASALLVTGAARRAAAAFLIAVLLLLLAAAAEARFILMH